jgi:nucleoside-diphosphate-sugar epimerase
MPGLQLDCGLTVDRSGVVAAATALSSPPSNRANYLGTKQLLGLASEMRNLRSFVFTSTYWVNNFKPYNTPVKEEVHYLTLQLAGELRE